jgi:uncharacterized RDD family membrane protein YckC
VGERAWQNPAMTPTSPGWYDDPHQTDQLRYFDGIVWTAHVAPRRTREATPPPAVVTPPGIPPTGTPQTGAPPTGASTPPADPYGWRAPSTPPTPPSPPQWDQPSQWQGQQWQGQQWQPAGATGPRTADGVPLASYWQRVGAAILDTLLAGLITGILGGWLVWKAVGPWFRDVMDAAQAGDSATVDSLMQNLSDRLTGGYFLAFVVVSTVVHLAYHLFFLTRSGATPGKKATGISVRLAERPGALSLDVALRRQLISVGVSLLSMLPGAVNGLGSLLSIADVLWPLWDPRRQALHDKIAGTQVVRGPQPPRSKTAR